MALQKALVVDSSEEFRDEICKLLQGEYLVQSCEDGQQALTALRKSAPDILVLDLMLPGLDGISLLRALKDEIHWPIILALTRFSSQYVIDAANDLDVAYLMIKPCDPKAVVSHLEALRSKSEPPLFSPPDQRALITNLLRSLCVPTKRMGYGFLREAVMLKIQDPRQPLMKELYPAVGNLFNATLNQVERDIRGAIEAAWAHRDAPSWHQLFPPKSDGTISRPTNAEFISRLADYVVSNQFSAEEEQRNIG